LISEDLLKEVSENPLKNVAAFFWGYEVIRLKLINGGKPGL